jgi:ABC-2 type transport system permease protein
MVPRRVTATSSTGRITTPVSSFELMLGKLVPYVFIGLVQTTLVLALGAALFDVPVQGSLATLYLAALIFIAATLAERFRRR